MLKAALKVYLWWLEISDYFDMMASKFTWKLAVVDLLTFGSSVLASIAFGGAVSASIVYLARFTLTERIRGAIKAEYDVKLLEQTHKYELLAAEHRLKLEKLQEKRILIVEETYGELREIYFMAFRFMQYDEKIEVNEEEVNNGFNEILKKWQAFMFQFDKRRIYRPKKTCDSVETIFDDIGKNAFEYASSVKVPFSAFEKTLTREQVAGILKKRATELKEQIKPAVDELEDELRKILGSLT